MDLSDDEVQRRAEADRREVDPPIQVETATWSESGQLDWWVKGRRDGGVAWTVQTAVNGWIRAVDLRPASGPQP
jgi:hypothetical protein